MSLTDTIQLVQARNEKAIATELGAPHGEPLPTDALLHLRRFHAFCKARGVKTLPSTPAVVAAYVRAEVGADIYDESILESLKAIEAVHDQNNLANPVATTIVRNEIARISSLMEKGPRSWPMEERAAFWFLPGTLREAILERDRHASKVVRKAQQEAADLRHELKSFQQEKVSNAKVSSK